MLVLSPSRLNKKKMMSMLLFVFITASSAMGQSSARVFTYDASGNRTAIGVPVSNAPKKGLDLQKAKNDGLVTVTSHPNGQVRLEVRMEGDMKEYNAKVFSSSGQLVAKLAKTSSPISTINLSDLQPGVYVIDVAIGLHHVTHKVVR